MKTIIICSGGEDGKDVRTAIRIEDDLFEKMFGSHIKDAMSFDEVELYLETAVEKIKSSIDYFEDELDRRDREIECLKKNSAAAREMSDKIQDLEARLEKVAGQRDYFKDELDKRKKEIEYLKETAVKARPVDCFKDELDKRDREIESLKEAVVRANENADSYYKLYSSEREAHKTARSMADALNTDFLEVREIVAKKCDHWSHTIWNCINNLSLISTDKKINDYSDAMILRNIANAISDFGANKAQGIMEGYEEEGEK